MNVKYALPALLVAALSAPVFAQTATTDTKAKAAADTKAAVEKKAPPTRRLPLIRNPLPASTSVRATRRSASSRARSPVS